MRTDVVLTLRGTQIEFFSDRISEAVYIIRKLLFAVLLVAGMSLFGIAGASAAYVGSAQTQYANHYAVQKHVNTHVKYYKYATQNRNINSYSNYYATTGSYTNSYKNVGSSTSANSASINSLASSLTSGTNSQYQKGENVFNWVRDNVKYKFYYNTKYGAEGTLQYRQGNCADKAHLVVALARSAGLPARYVHAQAHFRSGHVYGHYWAQIQANGQWYTADTTSRSNSFGVARNWNSAQIQGISNEI